MQSQLKKIGEVAKQLQTTPRTLRFYEEAGLVQSSRSQKGTRLYNEADVQRLAMILKLAQLDISLNDIKKLVTTRLEQPTGQAASQQVGHVLASLEEKVREKKLLYSQVEQQLKQALTLIQACRHCQNPPTPQGCPQCPLNQQIQFYEILSLIWESTE